MKTLRLPLTAFVLLAALTGCPSAPDSGGPAGTGPSGSATADATPNDATTPPTGAPATSPAPAGTTSPAGVRVTHFRTAYDWGVPASLVRVSHPAPSRRPYLAEIHAADHPTDGPGYSRISFYFRGGFPSYEFGYVPQVVGEGSGDPIPLPGNGAVAIRFSGATTHDEDGRPTIATSPRPDLGFRNLRGYGFGGDFEGDVTYGLGIQVAPGSDQVLRMRALELIRSDGFHVIAFDVQHG